jgi:hypothetical protein
MKNEAVKYTAEYKAIQEHYGDKKAERSGVPLIWHIDEGLEILELIGASKDAMRAYCLHPLFQNDEDLAKTLEENSLYVFSTRCVVLAMEYRARANDWLSDKVATEATMTFSGHLSSEVVSYGLPTAGNLLEVKQMLIADKVQNYIDFLQYHYGRHQRSNELAHYFLEWFKVLDIDEEEYTRIISHMYKST